MTPEAGDPAAGSGRHLKDLLNYVTASTDDLARTPAPNPTDKSLKERINEERYKELRAANRYRRAIVRFTLTTVAALVLAATIFMGLYVGSQWHHIEASVMIGYFSSIVVESIGILYIIARYLFPHSGPSPRSGDDLDQADQSQSEEPGEQK
jgi:hypothetical protein